MYNRTPGPSFLGIGPPKTATSWLYRSLRQLPDVNLPPVKEIGYWWEKSFLHDRNYISLFLNSHWFYKTRRRYIRQSFVHHLRNLRALQINKDKLLWDLHYTFFPRTDSWYSKLFDQHSVSGDITPKYSELKESDIAEIKQRYNDLRIVITARDPIEREWSRAKMNLCRKRNRQPDEVSGHEWIEHFDEPEQASANDYAALYERWSQPFGKENVHLIFFDEIQEDGWKVLQGLCQFLELNQPAEPLKDRITKPANIGIKIEIPKVYEQYLFAKHKDKMLRFADAFPHHRFPRDWLRKHGDGTR